MLVFATSRSGVIANLEVLRTHVGFPFLPGDRSTPAEAAARAGQMEACTWLLQNTCIQLDFALLREAAEGGNLQLFNLLLSKAPCLAHRKETLLLAAALRGGNTDLCAQMLAAGYKWPRSALEDALMSPDPVRSFRWAMEHGAPWNHTAAVMAARRGLAPQLRELCEVPEGRAWLAADESRGPRALLLMNAAHGCDLATLQWVEQAVEGKKGIEVRVVVGFGPQEIVGVFALASPTPDWRQKVEWLRSRGYSSCGGLTPMSESDWEAAGFAALPGPMARERVHRLGRWVKPELRRVLARSGAAEAIGLVLDSDAEHKQRDVVATMAKSAALGGHVSLLQLLRQRGLLAAQSEPAVVAAAAEGGHATAVEWVMRELGSAACGEAEMAAAARAGAVGLMTWLRAAPRSCGWGPKVFTAAAEGGCEAALEWLAKEGCPLGDAKAQRAHLDAAYRNRDAATGRHLVARLGCRWEKPSKPKAQWLADECGLGAQ